MNKAPRFVRIRSIVQTTMTVDSLARETSARLRGFTHLLGNKQGIKLNWHQPCSWNKVSNIIRSFEESRYSDEPVSALWVREFSLAVPPSFWLVRSPPTLPACATVGRHSAAYRGHARIRIALPHSLPDPTPPLQQRAATNDAPRKAWQVRVSPLAQQRRERPANTQRTKSDGAASMMLDKKHDQQAWLACLFLFMVRVIAGQALPLVNTSNNTITAPPLYRLF